MNVWEIKVTDKIDLAHKLDGHNKCGNLHGHSVKIVVSISSKELTDDGMVVDFIRVKDFIRKYDHRYLGDVMQVQTMEKLAKLIFGLISEYLTKSVNRAKIDYIEVWESESSVVKYSGENY